MKVRGLKESCTARWIVLAGCLGGVSALPVLGMTIRLHPPLQIKVNIDRALESKKGMDLQPFLVTVSEAVKAEGCIVIKKDAQGQGQVIGSFPAEKKGLPGKLQLQLLKLTFADGKTLPLSTKPLEKLGEKAKSEKTMKIFPKKGGEATIAKGEELIFETDMEIELSMNCIKQ